MAQKRKAEYQLDRDHYQDQMLSSKPAETELVSDKDRICSSQEIRQRKIYRAKRIKIPGDVYGNRPIQQKKFKILGVLDIPKLQRPPQKVQVQSAAPSSQENKDEGVFKPPKPSPKRELQTQPIFKNPSAPSIFSQSKTSDNTTKSVFAVKPDADSAKKLVSLFGSGGVTESKQTPTTSKSSVFSKKLETPTESKKHAIPGITALPEKPCDTNVLFKPKGDNSQSVFAQGVLSNSKDISTAFAAKTKESVKSDQMISSNPVHEDKQLNPTSLFGKPATVFATASSSSQPAPSILAKSEGQPTSQGLFAKKGEDNADKKDTWAKDKLLPGAQGSSQPKTSLFGKPPTTSIFGKPIDKSESKPQPDQEQEEKPKHKSLFGNTTAVDGKSGSLFNLSTSGPLFGANKSLLGGKSNFGNVSSLTKAEDQKQSFIKSGPAEEEKDGSSDSPKEADDSKPRFKSISKDPYQKIFNRMIEKFRMKEGDKGNGLLSIETGQTNGKKFVLFNFRNPIGKTLFTGQVIASCKKVATLDKPGKVQLKVVVIKKEEGTGQMKPAHCILTFMRTDDKKEFEKQWDEALKYLTDK